MEDRKTEPMSHEAPHRRGVLRGVAAGAASGLGLRGDLAQAKAPAERGSPSYGSIVYIEDFAPDYHGPEYDWSSAIYRAMKSFPGNDKHLPGGTIVFANKHNLEAYEVKSTIVVRRQIEFLGTMPTSVNGYVGINSTLRFPPHTDGFHFINQDKGPDAVGSRLANLRIVGGGGTQGARRGHRNQGLGDDRDPQLLDRELVRLLCVLLHRRAGPGPRRLAHLEQQYRPVRGHGLLRHRPQQQRRDDDE